MTKKLPTIQISEKTTLEELLKTIDEGGEGIALDVDDDGTLCGCVSDGDVRRGLLRKISEPTKLVNRCPITAKETTNDAERISLTTRNRINQLIIVNEKNQPTSIFTKSKGSSTPARMENFVVIMAGGLGSRLGSLTNDTPKPMLKIGTKPILQIIMERFAREGFTKFKVSVNYKKQIIKEYFGDGKNFGYEIDYIEEFKRLGTAGALGLIEDINDLPFFVTNGDLLTEVDCKLLLKEHTKNNADATICTRKKSIQIPYGVLETDEYGNLVKITEKPTIVNDINAGIYLLNRSVLEYVEKNEFIDMPSLLIKLVKSGMTVRSFNIKSEWIDIGTPEEYQRAQEAKE